MALQIMLQYGATNDSVCAMDHTDIIKTLGGAKVVADALRERGVIVADVTVRSWTLAGRLIPAKYWSHIAAIGRDQGHSVSFEALAQAAAA
jgi:hypothetical protein